MILSEALKKLHRFVKSDGLFLLLMGMLFTAPFWIALGVGVVCRLTYIGWKVAWLGS